MNPLVARLASFFNPAALKIVVPSATGSLAGNGIENVEEDLATLEEFRRLTHMDRRRFLRLIGGTGSHLAVASVAGPINIAAFFDIGAARQTARIGGIVKTAFAIAGNTIADPVLGLSPLDFHGPSYVGMAKRALADALRIDFALGTDPPTLLASWYAAPLLSCGGVIPIGDLRRCFFKQAREGPFGSFPWGLWGEYPGLREFQATREGDPKHPRLDAVPDPNSREPEPIWENPWLGIGGGVAAFHGGHFLPFVEDLKEDYDYTLPWNF